jgi:ABC-type amino acid transport system permease subunit
LGVQNELLRSGVGITVYRAAAFREVVRGILKAVDKEITI